MPLRRVRQVRRVVWGFLVLFDCRSMNESGSPNAGSETNSIVQLPPSGLSIVKRTSSQLKANPLHPLKFPIGLVQRSIFVRNVELQSIG